MRRIDDLEHHSWLWTPSKHKGPVIDNPDFVEAMGDDYLYFSCVRFVLEFKKGPIAETSPMLNDISAVGRWAKVHSGMLKMYHGEVLSKFPIVQHMRFGTLFPWVAGG